MFPALKSMCTDHTLKMSFGFSTPEAGKASGSTAALMSNSLVGRYRSLHNVEIVAEY